MIGKQTTLDLNGPILSFTTQPIDVTVDNAGIATFVGIATATFQHKTHQIQQQTQVLLNIDGILGEVHYLMELFRVQQSQGLEQLL
jgi:predicted secreted protein